jgi:prepilin-type N-terminal cleavage/methylation domain-containing protein
MKTRIKSNKGFTLIELLVVVAIIGLLSSIVLASVNSARLKAKDVSTKEEINQLATLATLSAVVEGQEYCYFQASWVPFYSCSFAFQYGKYASNAQAICNNIVNNSIAGGQYIMFTDSNAAMINPCLHAYSYMVLLNDGNWYCAGSSGARGEYANWSGQPGCYDNP